MLVPETEILIFQDGNQLLQRVLRPGDYVIGRSPACDLSLASSTVSRKHAKLTVNFSSLFLEDLGSFNGTTVNGGRISGKTQIWHGQRILIGNATMELRKICADPELGGSLAPAQEAVLDCLPEDVTFHHSGYQIGQLIGRGGMGAVLQAEDASIQRQVAMKVILHGDSPRDVLRFIQEARITGRLEHPNIIPVHTLGADEHGQPFYTMKLVRGATLKQVLQGLARGEEDAVRNYPLTALLTIFQKVCDAMRFAHSQRVIHRDLKPDNVMLGDYGEVLVMDWGLAKNLRDAEEEIAQPSGTEPNADSTGTGSSENDSYENNSNTRQGSILGTPQYMPPEQARGESSTLDERADIYALGAILYHILTLRPPIPPGPKEQVLRRVVEGDIVTPTEAVSRNLHTKGVDKKESPGETLEGESTETDDDLPTSGHLPHLPAGRIPQSLEAVVMKAIAPAASERYASVAELQGDLSAYQTGFATEAEHASTLKHFYLFLKRNRTVSAVALLSLCLGTAFTVESHRSSLALERLRKVAPLFLEQAMAKLEAGRIQDAIEKVAFATEVDPSNGDYLLLKARLLQGQGHLNEAGNVFKRVLLLRKDLVASENLDLCTRLTQTYGDGPELPDSGKAALLHALQRQGRAKDAADLLSALLASSAENLPVLEQRLASIPGWSANRLKSLPDGTFGVTLSGLAVESLDFLEGLPVTDLKLDNCKVGGQPSLLESLQKLPLKNLSMRSCGLENLAFLIGLAPESLDLANNPVADLLPLQGLPVRHLNLARNQPVDVTPLSTCPRLERLVLPQSPSGLETLKALPSLKRISFEETGGGPTLSVEEFWNKYQQPSGRKAP